MPHSSPSCLSRYRAVTRRLLRAIADQHAARAAYDAARDAFEDRRRCLLLSGVPGLPERCSAELREAALGRALDAQAATLRSTRDRLRQADAELEAARVEERMERETLRMYGAERAQDRPEWPAPPPG